MEASAPDLRPPLLLGFDFEDWHQLVYRRLGLANWDAPRPPFERQVEAILSLLDELDASATFFLVGMTAKNYPRLVEQVAGRGHEIACHGYAHVPAFRQTRSEFSRDLQEALAIIGELTGREPDGYRAPVFSITRDTPWVFDVLAELGFAWDSSLHDSPRIAGRLGGIPGAPFRLRTAEGRELWEFPIAVWPLRGLTVPLGGGSYWRVFPWALLERGLVRRSAEASGGALYFHPYEFDPEPLRVELSGRSPLALRLRALQRTMRASPLRARIPRSLRRLDRWFRLTSYEDAFEDLTATYGGCTRSLSGEGVLV
jgi:polysaccharide deacetylase family protein (PEP-CTERM system associated)